MSGYLHHLQIGAEDPARLAGFYEAALAAQIRKLQDGRYLVHNRDRRLLLAPGTPKHLDFAAYVFDAPGELARLREKLPARLIEPSPSPFFGAKAFSVRDPDNNRIVFGQAEDALVLADAADIAGPPARLQHLVVSSTGCAAMADFYATSLGFTISDCVYKEDGTLTTCFLRSSNEHHSFAVFQAAKSGLDHHCYETPDWNAVRDWADWFAKLQIPLSWGPGRHGPGNNLFIFINDPEGNWLEFSAELEIVGPDRPIGTWPHAERTLNQWGRAPLRS